MTNQQQDVTSKFNKSHMLRLAAWLGHHKIVPSSSKNHNNEKPSPSVLFTSTRVKTSSVDRVISTVSSLRISDWIRKVRTLLSLSLLSRTTSRPQEYRTSAKTSKVRKQEQEEGKHGTRINIETWRRRRRRRIG